MKFNDLKQAQTQVREAAGRAAGEFTTGTATLDQLKQAKAPLVPPPHRSTSPMRREPRD